MDALIEPVPFLAGWDYGLPGQQYTCWNVFHHEQTGTDIAFCNEGFGPRCPWGLMDLHAQPENGPRMGMDSGWLPNFMECFWESFAATALPVWRIFVEPSHGDWRALTEEGEWDATWAETMRLRESDPQSRYHVRHSIDYLKPDWAAIRARKEHDG